MTNSPTVWRRWLAFELRRLREERSLAQREVGKRCGWSGVRLSYIENLQQNVTADDLAQLLPLYEVPKDRWDDFYEAAERSREQGFWERYDQRVIPDWLTLYVGLEQGASLIRAVEPLVVPALLQVPEYVAATIRTDFTPHTEQQIARIVELKMTRQAVLSREEAPLQLSVVVDESVLHRVAGGADTMAKQLGHLAAMAARPNVSIRIFPFERGIYRGLITAYEILTFPDGSDPGVVYVEYQDGALYLDGLNQVDNHILAFEHASRAALPLEDSRTLLKEAADAYSRDGRIPFSLSGVTAR